MLVILLCYDKVKIIWLFGIALVQNFLNQRAVCVDLYSKINLSVEICTAR